MNLTEREIWLDGKQLAGVCGRKCGLITVTVFEDEYVFQLNCQFCPNVFSCFDNFSNHIKIKHPPLSFKYLKNEKDNESDRENRDELICDRLLFSDEFQKEIKVEYEYEGASNVSLSRELHGNRVNDNAEFILEAREHSMGTLSSADPCKIEEFYVSESSKGSPLNTKEVLEKISIPILTSSGCQPIEEPVHFHYQKNKIKLEYEETANVNSNQEHMCNELQDNQSNDDADFVSKHEKSVCGVQESSYVTSPKNSKVYKVWRIGDPENRELTLDIIKMWKSFPCLWDPKCDDYTQEKRMETWGTIAHSLKQKWKCEFPKDTLLRKIGIWRMQYDIAVRSKRRPTTSKVPVPWFFEELSFLAPQTYYCEECDRFFCSEDSFNHHKYTHDGIARYVCNICNKEFASPVLLKTHKITHVGVVQKNQVNDDAQFILEDCEHSMETLSSVDPCKIEEFYVSELRKGSPLNTKETLEKMSTSIPTSSRCQSIQESAHVNLPKDSKFHHPKNEIKLKYEEASNVNLNQKHLCNELQENQSNDGAEFLAEDKHSVESFHGTFPKDSKVNKIWRAGDPKNRELALDIIKLWKSYPCLWDQKFHTKKKRLETWDKIRHSLKQKWNCEIPKYILLRKIRFLRTLYEQEVRKRRKATTSKDATVPWFFEELSFLAAGTYYCEECDKFFRSEDSFSPHKYRHVSVARYVCSVCNKEFALAFQLKRHITAHSGVCGKKIPIKSQLTTHLRRHTGTKEDSIASSEL